jgi:hypothetical protein
VEVPRKIKSEYPTLSLNTVPVWKMGGVWRWTPPPPKKKQSVLLPVSQWTVTMTYCRAVSQRMLVDYVEGYCMRLLLNVIT